MPARPKPSAEFRDYVMGQMGRCGDVRAKAMFGGTGIYVDEVFCAIVTGSSRFFLRVDDSNRGDFEARGMEPFKGHGTSLMPYFEVPPEVLEDSAELQSWVARARAAAQAAAKRKKPRKRQQTRRGPEPLETGDVPFILAAKALCNTETNVPALVPASACLD